jgi:hypothetical protein
MIYYLFGTRFLGIIYNREYQITIMITSNILFINDPDIWCFFQGYVILLFGESIIWKIIY